MTTFRAIIDGAVADAMAEHPKYFTPKGMEHARAAIVRKIMASLRDTSEQKSDAPAAPTAPAAAGLFDPASPDARAACNLRAAAGAVLPMRTGGGQVLVNPEALTPAALAFADCPPREVWLFLTDRRQIAAWKEFFAAALPGVARRPIDIVRGGETGILAPWPWPPAASGKIFSADRESAA